MKEVLRFLVGLSLVMAGVGLSVSPVQAAERVPQQAGAAAASCSKIFDIGRTYKSGRAVNGEGSYTDCGNQQIEVTMEKYKGLGVWLTVKGPLIRTSSGIQPISYNCSGKGTQTYRAKVKLFGPDGGRGCACKLIGTKTSNEIRVSC